MPLSPHLRQASFAGLQGWPGEGLRHAFAAFSRSADHAAKKPYRTGALGLEAQAFEPAFAAARRAGALDDHAARGFFESHFVPFCLPADDGGDGFVTGFYEPEHEACRVETERFRVPLLAPPDDLVKIDDANRPAGFDPAFAFGLREGGRIVHCFDRSEIDRGALAGRARPLAWLADPVDAYFVHVQGAVRLAMPDGAVRRFTYAAKSGHPFTGAGRVLLELGELQPGAVTMQSIRAWFRANPARVHDILWRNRSYIFFREAPVDDPSLGPVAAAKVPLTAGHSIAVDRLLHSFGTPVFVDAPQLDAFGAAPFRRLMIAQDTGSAIVGAARGDLFAGSGDAAGEVAGVIRHRAVFHLLVPRALATARP